MAKSGGSGGRSSVLRALKKRYGSSNVLSGKNSGFNVRGQGFISLSKARRLTGIASPKRVSRGRTLPWGDYATIAMLNAPRR